MPFRAAIDPRILRINGLTPNLVRAVNPYALKAIAAVAKNQVGVSEAFVQYANEEGKFAALEALRKFPAAKTEIERLLLKNDDVRAYLLARVIIEKGAKADRASTLASAAIGLLRSTDASQVQNDLGLAAEPDSPWQIFFDELVDRIVIGENLNVTAAAKRSISKRFRDVPPGISGDLPVEAVETFVRNSRSPALQNLDKFITESEIDEDLIDGRTKRAMLEYVEDLGVNFEPYDKANPDRYDEYFALAYDSASRQLQTGDDPLQAKFTGNVTDWDFDVDTLESLEQQDVIAKNIRAAGALDYIYQLGERLGVFKLVDALVLRWAYGSLDIPDGEGASKLYRYWKLRDDRFDEKDRQYLLKRVLARGNTKLLRGMVANDDFPVLWRNLMEDTARFIERSENIRPDDRGPSKVRIERDTRQLQYNLTEHMTGMAQVQTAEIYAQLRDGLEILSDPDVVSILAGGRRRNLWTVIETLSKEEFGVAVNVEAMRTVAIDGNRVFNWVADFTPGAGDGTGFDELLDSAERWIVAEASIEGDNLNLDDGAEDEDGFDDDFDDFTNDEFDGFADDEF